MLELTCIGNMTYQEAADLAGNVGTRIVIPGHWDLGGGRRIVMWHRHRIL